MQVRRWEITQKRRGINITETREITSHLGVNRRLLGALCAWFLNTKLCRADLDIDAMK